MKSAMSEGSSEPSALLIPVPEAESIVRTCREQYDPSARAGIPAHITVLYPFAPSGLIDQDLLADLRRLFASYSGFDYALTHTARFPQVLYLSPEPAEPFVTLTEAVVARYPDYPPYNGAVPNIIPHLTVANIGDEEKLNHLEAAFMASYDRQLPLRASARHVWLMEQRGGIWRKHTTFGLG